MTQLGDSDESTTTPSPSKSARKPMSSGHPRSLSMRGGIPRSSASAYSHSSSAALPPKVREVDGIVEILDSDEENASPPLKESASRIESSKSPIVAIHLPSASIKGNDFGITFRHIRAPNG